KVIVLEHYCPWTEHLFDLEKELNIEVCCMCMCMVSKRLKF
ncbi:hypothetical protein EON63_18060, partial [archaeon]